MQNWAKYNKKKFKSLPFTKFTDVTAHSNVQHFQVDELDQKHFHPSRLPVYMLDEKFQSQHAHNKWSN